jgi:hypothetical protein
MSPLASRSVRVLLPLAAAVVAGAVPAPARAAFTCQRIDVPAATATQVWQLNGAGQVATTSDVGSFVYSAGAWLPPPAPPAGSGYGVQDVRIMAVNDSGDLTGGAGDQSFVLRGGVYEFFSYRPDLWPATEARAISASGIVTGSAYDADSNGVAFLYNPLGLAPHAPGFTEIVPVLPDGTRSRQTIPGNMDRLGRFVGSGRFPPNGRTAFLYDPAWQASGASGPYTFFRFGGQPTSARGLNERGDVVGFYADPSGRMQAFLRTAAGTSETITCAQLPWTTGDVFAESINDSGVVAGMYAEEAGSPLYHGFIAYPDAALPVASVDGAFVFDAAVEADAPVFLDPVPAVGYRYEIGAGDPLFSSVTLPIAIGDGRYTVLAGGLAFAVAGGQRLDFAREGFAPGVTAFEVLGIEPGAALDPASPTAFVTEVTFASAGRFTGAMTPMTAADVLRDLRDAADASGRRDLAERARRAGDFLARGDAAATCKALGDFVRKVAVKTGKELAPALARALDAEAAAAAQAVGCAP